MFGAIHDRLESFMESWESDSTLLENQSKYNVVISTLVGVIYWEMSETAHG